jgi:hypothetical protein
MLQSILSFLNVNKSYLALLAVIVLQLAQANHWFIVPSDTMNLIIGVAGGAGLASISHSNAAAVKATTPPLMTLASHPTDGAYRNN